MCIVSNVGDGWGKTFPEKWPQVPTDPLPTFDIKDVLAREEIEKLKLEMEELKKLLLAAKRFDEATGQPNCEMDEKVALIKGIADLVGVDLKEVFGNKLKPGCV